MGSQPQRLHCTLHFKAHCNQPKHFTRYVCRLLDRPARPAVRWHFPDHALFPAPRPLPAPRHRSPSTPRSSTFARSSRPTATSLTSTCSTRATLQVRATLSTTHPNETRTSKPTSTSLCTPSPAARLTHIAEYASRHHFHAYSLPRPPDHAPAPSCPQLPSSPKPCPSPPCPGPRLRLRDL